MRPNSPGRTLVITVIFALGLSGCMSFEIETGLLQEDAEAARNSTIETIHSSLWGIEWSDHVVEKCDNDFDGANRGKKTPKNLGIYRVEYSTNAGYLLLSVLTLGLYVPQTVEWWCLVEKPKDTGGPTSLPPE